MALRTRSVENFRANVRAVEQLRSFDDNVLQFIIAPLEGWAERVKRGKFEITNPHLRPDHIVSTIRDIRSNESLRLYYEEMYNQCVVLLVS